MPIQILNRNLSQYSTDLSKFTPHDYLSLIEKIAADPELQPVIQVQVSMQYGWAQITGSIEECKSLLPQIESEDQPHAFSCSIQTNTNPRKTVSLSISHAQSIVTIQVHNTDKKASKKIIDVVQSTLPKTEGKHNFSQQTTPTESQPSVGLSNVPSQKIDYLPGAFRPIAMPELSDKDVFIIMSFSKEHRDAYFVVIEPVLKNLGFNPVRVDQIQHNATVTPEILRQIERSAFVIADLTGEKPNVYYEVGYAHRADKEVILISKRDTAVHFDVAAINRIIYEDFTELREALEKRIKSTAERLDISTTKA